MKPILPFLMAVILLIAAPCSGSSTTEQPDKPKVYSASTLKPLGSDTGYVYLYSEGIESEYAFNRKAWDYADEFKHQYAVVGKKAIKRCFMV